MGWQSKMVDVVLYNFEGGKATAVTAGDCVDKCKVIPASFKKSIHTLEKYRGTKKDPSSVILKSEKVFCDEGIHPMTNGKKNSAAAAAAAATDSSMSMAIAKK